MYLKRASREKTQEEIKIMTMRKKSEVVGTDAFQFSFKFMLMTADHSETLIFNVSAPFQVQVSGIVCTSDDFGCHLNAENVRSPMQFACFQHRLEIFPMAFGAFQMTSDAI